MNGQLATDGEAGATDNRLSLNPNAPEWSDTIGEWKDGQKYTLTVEVEQVSPGEFTVLSATPAASKESEEPAAGETAGESETAERPEYPNPAIAKMAA